MDNKKLNKVRNLIDRLDIQLLNLIKKRTKLVNHVIKIKKYKKQIVDKKRINKVLKKIKKNSVKKNIDPKITVKIWSTMTKAYIDYEKRNFYKR